jgi:hypothetical protein
MDWACTHYLPGNCKFLGVLPANLVPSNKVLKTVSGPLAFIANTDPSFEPGSHWLAFYRANSVPCKLECFDSFGMPASCYGFLNDAAYSSTSVNRTQFQANNSAACGYYALYFLFHRASFRTSLFHILNPLHYCLPLSADNYVKEFVKDYWPFPSTPAAHCKFCCNHG